MHQYTICRSYGLCNGVKKMNKATQVQILDEAVCISLNCVNVGKGMSSSLQFHVSMNSRE